MASGAGRPTAPVLLDAEDRAYLERQIRQHQLSRAFAERCRIILRCAAGLSSKAVAAELGIHEHTVGEWRRRFLTFGVEGLKPRREKAAGARR